MFKKIINLFSNNKYSLILKDIESNSTCPYVFFTTPGDPIPIKFHLNEIFDSKKSIRESIDPDSLLLLRNLYDKIKNNKYKPHVVEYNTKTDLIKINSYGTIISVYINDLCQDYALCHDIGLEFILPIITDYFYKKGYTDCKLNISDNDNSTVNPDIKHFEIGNVSLQVIS